MNDETTWKTCLAVESVAGACDRPARTPGAKYCTLHQSRWSYRGTLEPSSWGSGSINQSGYRLISGRDRPGCYGNGMLLEHRVVMEEVLGRPLFPGETVHHKNGVRADNRPENLELWSRSQPPGQRIADRVNWAIGILETYAPHLLCAQSKEVD